MKRTYSLALLFVRKLPIPRYANTVVGFTCLSAGKHAEALQACERAVRLDPESYLGLWCFHMALHLNGRFEEAVAAGEAALAMSGRHPWAMATLAATFADWGKPADSEAVYAELAARARRLYVPPPSSLLPRPQPARRTKLLATPTGPSKYVTLLP
jgi:predicted Zn-dependent protease